MNRQVTYYRHGDVTMQTLEKIPDQFKDFKPIQTKKVILALGEVTGHSHRILPVDDAEILVYSKDGVEKPDPNDDEILVHIKKGEGILVHEEHGPIVLKEGFHWRGMKKQFNPFTNAVENVRD